MKKLLTIMLILLLCGCSHEQRHDKDIEGDSRKAADLYTYDVEEKIASLGITLSEAPAPAANYVNAVRTGNLLYLAGKGPSLPEGGYITGKVGVELTIEEGYEAGRLAAIAHLSVLKAELGDLNKVVQLVKVLGMVNCAPDFKNQPEVMNGYSDLMVAVFGERGKHARSAVGMMALPRGIAVEVEVIVEVQ